jgi:serine/threonine-protein kinase
LETVSRAVHHGHQRGILHRDLKPANVLLDAVGVPYVADFGLAKALDSEARVTQPGSVEGTLSYMPLEQAQPGGQPLTVAVDVYSLGVILYELLTGQLPFEADSFDALLGRMRESKPLAPRAIDPRIPRSLETICLKCLEKEPARRYGSAAEMADDLKRFLENRPILAMPVGPIVRGWMWCLRHLREVGLLASLTWAFSVTLWLAREQADEVLEELNAAKLWTNEYLSDSLAERMAWWSLPFGLGIGLLWLVWGVRSGSWGQPMGSVGQGGSKAGARSHYHPDGTRAGELALRSASPGGGHTHPERLCPPETLLPSPPPKEPRRKRRP